MKYLVLFLALLLLLLPAVASAKSQTSVDTRPVGERTPISAEKLQAIMELSRDLSRWLAAIPIEIEKSQSGGSTIYPDPCKTLYGPLLPQCQPERKPVPVLPCP